MLCWVHAHQDAFGSYDAPPAPTQPLESLQTMTPSLLLPVRRFLHFQRCMSAYLQLATFADTLNKRHDQFLLTFDVTFAKCIDTFSKIHTANQRREHGRPPFIVATPHVNVLRARRASAAH